MTDQTQIWTAIISAVSLLCSSLLSVAGVLAGYAISHLQTSRQLEMQENIEKQKQLYDKENLREEKHREILEKRCNQAEEGAKLLSNSLYRFQQSCIYYVEEDDPIKSAAWKEKDEAWRGETDQLLFSYGQIINSINDSELQEIWVGMAQCFENIGKNCFHIYRTKFIDKTKIYGIEQLSETRLLQAEFMRKGADFLQRLDKIRGSQYTLPIPKT
jgi:hypothetical protein